MKINNITFQSQAFRETVARLNERIRDANRAWQAFGEACIRLHLRRMFRDAIPGSLAVRGPRHIT